MKEIPQVVWCEFETQEGLLLSTHKHNPLDPAYLVDVGIKTRVKNGLSVLQEYKIKPKGGLG